jgi:peptidoglycan/xylan/chitin deacetylase (PgdA/CDA1 family)
MIALMYHDVVEAGAEDTSGFPGADAATYKVTPALLDEHLQAICGHTARSARPVVTFDDGGASATVAADHLERFGLRGWFFITANFIGTRGFVDAGTIRRLRDRGHGIGSHSCSHPFRAAHCGRAHLLEEWTRSRLILADLLGADVIVASVPGGDYAPSVADAAAEAGFVELFTSEPTSRSTARPGGLVVHGRFTIRSWTSAATARALATGHWWPRARQSAMWNVKKVGKLVGGEGYLRLRRFVFADPRWQA